jgi:hypothetical protein
MAQTIDIEVPRQGLGSDLTDALAGYGLRAEIVESEDECRLVVSFVDGEVERLLTSATHAVEAYLADRMLPLVVQRGNGGCVVRPPAD